MCLDISLYSPASLLPSCDWLYLCGSLASCHPFNGFACFSSVLHAGRSMAEFLLPWSLGLLIIAVASVSRLFRVARCMTLLPERLGTTLLSLSPLYKKHSCRETAFSHPD